MKGGISLGGITQPNFEFNAASYGSKTIPTSMTGGRRHHHSRKLRRHRGGMGYGFLPSGSDLNAKDSYLANVAPYSVY